MKKLWLVFVLSFVLIFAAGCSDEQSDVSDTKIRSSVDDSYENEDEKDTKDSEDDVTKKDNDIVEEDEAEANAGSIDESYLEDIGRSVQDMEDARGKLSEFYWEDGPIYRFGSNRAWYGFEDYEYSDSNECIPKGACNVVSVPLKDLVKGTAKYNADALEGITGNKFGSVYDEMYGMNVFVIEYKDYQFSIYAETKGDITQDSIVGVERK